MAYYGNSLDVRTKPSNYWALQDYVRQGGAQASVSELDKVKATGIVPETMWKTNLGMSKATSFPRAYTENAMPFLLLGAAPAPLSSTLLPSLPGEYYGQDPAWYAIRDPNGVGYSQYSWAPETPTGAFRRAPGSPISNAGMYPGEGYDPELNLYTVLRNLLGQIQTTATPQQAYAAYSPEAIKARAQQALGVIPLGTDENAGYLEPIRLHLRDLANTAAGWQPGGANVSGARRTMAQQQQYEKAMADAMNFGAKDVRPAAPGVGPPNPSGQAYSDYEQNLRTYGSQLQDKAWQLWQPAFMQMFGPETATGGGMPSVRPPAWNRTTAATVRPQAWQPTSSSNASWSFAPRWGGK
jgi:hypothetical protein